MLWEMGVSEVKHGNSTSVIEPINGSGRRFVGSMAADMASFGMVFGLPAHFKSSDKLGIYDRQDTRMG